MKKINLLLSLLIIAAILTGCVEKTDSMQIYAQQSTEEVVRGNLMIGLNADGKAVLPEIALNFEVSGEISQIYVSPGSVVKKGDVIAELDAAKFYAAIENAKIALSKAEAEYNEAIELSDYMMITEKENLENLYIKYNTKFDESSYLQEISSAQAELERSEKELNDAKIILNNALSDSLTDFDSRSYDNAVSNSNLTLERRKSELEEARKTLENALDSYESFIMGVYNDDSVKNLETALELRKAELNVALEKKNAALLASKSYIGGMYADNDTQNLESALKVKKDELNEAEKLLNDALSSNPKLYNSYNNEIAISNAWNALQNSLKDLNAANNELSKAKSSSLNLQSAQTTYDNKYKEYNTAVLAKETAYINYLVNQNEATLRAYSTALETENTAHSQLMEAQTAVTNARDASTRIENAQSSVNDAQISVDTAQAAYDKAVSDASISLEKYIGETKTKVENLRKEVSDAQNLLDIARGNINDSFANGIDEEQRGVDNAQIAFDNAQAALEKAYEDLKASMTKNVSDAQSRVNTAQIAVDNAKESLEKANADLTHAKSNYISENNRKLNKTIEEAQLRYTNAQKSYSEASETLKKAQNKLPEEKENYITELESILNSIKLLEREIEDLNNTSLVDKAYSKIENAKSNLREAEIDFTKIQIKAPFDGKIVQVTKTSGDSASNSSYGDFITIRDTSKTYFKASVSESDINSVEVGQSIRVISESLENKEFYATVESIGTIPETDITGIKKYEVTGQMDKQDEDIKDNMSISMTFIKRERKDVLLISNNALITESGQKYVYVEINGNVEKREVTCGLSDDSQIEIIGGLKEGEKVLIAETDLK